MRTPDQPLQTAPSPMKVKSFTRSPSASTRPTVNHSISSLATGPRSERPKLLAALW